MLLLPLAGVSVISIGSFLPWTAIFTIQGRILRRYLRPARCLPPTSIGGPLLCNRLRHCALPPLLETHQLSRGGARCWQLRGQPTARSTLHANKHIGQRNQRPSTRRIERNQLHRRLKNWRINRGTFVENSVLFIFCPWRRDYGKFSCVCTYIEIVGVYRWVFYSVCRYDRDVKIGKF